MWERIKQSEVVVRRGMLPTRVVLDRDAEFGEHRTYLEFIQIDDEATRSQLCRKHQSDARAVAYARYLGFRHRGCMLWFCPFPIHAQNRLTRSGHRLKVHAIRGGICSTYTGSLYANKFLDRVQIIMCLWVKDRPNYPSRLLKIPP